MRVTDGRQQFKCSWAPDNLGRLHEASWVYACNIDMSPEALEEMARFNAVDESDASLLANDARVNALLEREPAPGDRVLLQLKEKLVAGCVASRSGDSLSVTLDGHKRASACALEDVLSIAPRRTAAQVGRPVRAILTAEDGSRRWYYGQIACLAPGRELVSIRFDDKQTMTLAVYDVQDAQLLTWL